MSASPALTAFLVGALVAFLVTFVEGTKAFYFDSGGYWNLSETFTRSGHFSFFDFEDALRGYSWPLILWALKNSGEVVIANQSLLVRGFNATIFALIGAVLVPALAKVAWPRVSWNVTRRLGLTALIILYWNGYLSFPLTDFPALAAALVALVAISRSDSPAWLFLAGLAAGLALNIRPAYILLPPLLVGLLAWDWIDGRGNRPASAGRRLLCAVALLAGFAMISTPQSISQHERYGDYDPIPGSSELKRIQYTIGLKLQRYDTYLNDMPRMEYLDWHTLGLIAELDSGEVDNTGEYLSLVAHHPITMAGVFLRHLVNGLDQRYTEPYVETLETDRGSLSSTWHLLLRIGGFLLVFLAMIRVIWPAGRRSLGPARWRYPVALLGIALSSLPSAMEPRFLLPGFVLAAALVFAPGWRGALGESWAKPNRYRGLALVLCAGAAYAVVVWLIVNAASESLRIG